MDEVENVLSAIGPRLRALRGTANVTLATVSERTGIPVSTLSRLESGQRKPSLELLLPLARAYDVPLDDIVDAPETGDPRVRLTPVTSKEGVTAIPLTRRAGGLQAFKQIIPGNRYQENPTLRSHEGYHWIYVLDGRLRLILGDRDLVLGAGEVAEFDTHLPHWFGSADRRPVEYLGIYGPQGERMHVTATFPVRKTTAT
ncbi:MAG: helix-turn-helix domain-containing protein [Rhodococcus sp. (in: high G+C Gram-positive bacteria)]